MAERSGDPALDAIIEDFIGQGTWLSWDDDGDEIELPIEPLRTREGAEGYCGMVSDDFAEMCANQGLDAIVDLNTANGYGYSDRTIRGKFPNHNLTRVTLPSGVYTVDFTAAQYGYSEFPLVQRRHGRRWQRTWPSVESVAA